MMRSEILSRLKALIQRGDATPQPQTHSPPSANAERKEPPARRKERPASSAASAGLARGATARTDAHVDRVERRSSADARTEDVERAASINTRTESAEHRRSTDGRTGAMERPRSTDERAGGAERRRSVEEAAYYRAERRGFQPGFEMTDWLEAEREVDARRGNGRA